MKLEGQPLVSPWVFLSEQAQGPYGDNVLY